MEKLKPLTELSVADLWKEVKWEEEILGDLRGASQIMLKRFLEGCMDEEIGKYVGGQWHERSMNRVSYRNGYYERDLETGLGLLKRLSIPRSRDGKYRTKVFKRYQRRQEEVTGMIREAFIAGVSTRRVSEVMNPLLGYGVSAGTVSKISKSLNEEVEKYQGRPLEDRYRYLILDGVYLKVRIGVKVKKRLVLCAYGIGWDGVREIVSFRLSRSESEKHWEGFVNDLYNRGLTGERLELIVTDGCKGLINALETVYPYVKRQRCWVHKLRNVSNRLRKRDQEECIKGARKIYKAENRKGAVQKYWSWARRWRNIAPGAVKCLEEDLEELLAFFDFPEPHRRKIRTTNAIERTFREVRRRTRPMSSFTNSDSCNRIIYSVVRHLNNKWENSPLKEITQKS
jgi:putative transposase